ncbi:HAMP domain-containing protein [Rummeliibacillus sp. TYF005]|uniref:ATP-binding protein n=1 Tax=unclassified Rummeliibacillus TaxID=2622809 RepID=UPI000E670378|nr:MULTISPECIES: ATP-binding protein [unclassified Rummeliibacillus]RIJ63877.1 HAMP domain-containing protein [Rummeliibacillus sp. POC4]RPJ96770.1 HAMP domain-containing protein [Rummeliibacillus sp. TYF005]
MIRISNSVVGKLWVTILLLVSFVLFVFTVLMLEFLSKYHTQQSEALLRQEATTIARVVDDHETTAATKSIINDILSDETNAVIADAPGKVAYSLQEGLNQEKIKNNIISEKAFEKVFVSDDPVVKEMMLPSSTEKDHVESYIVMAFPLNVEKMNHGVVYIYQSPDAIHRTSKETTKIVFLSATIAFVLTTFFAFFLSTRITSPLRKMREAAFELAKGNFDKKVPVLQNDEIGQLGTAFNQMGRQLKHHMEVISQEKEQLSSILTSMTDAVITFNSDRSVILSNPPAELLLQKWFFNKGSDSERPIPEEIYHMLDHVIDMEEELQEELELDGTYFMISISPLYSGDSVRGAVAVLRDKTEEHRLDKLRSDFIANVSHELRTPIAMLQGYSEAIIDDVVSSEEERNEMIKIIYDESQRMGRLVTDLLDLARMESGNITLYKDIVPITPVFERITQKFVQAAKEKKIELKYSSTFDDNIQISLDEDRIEQVLTNLIDNAIRHTQENGTVEVIVDQQVSYARIQVKDNGAGIPKEDLDYVFERFYKADKARTRGKGGTGLGLAIAKNIVEAHKGRITVESEVDVGTSFIFFLPLEIN